MKDKIFNLVKNDMSDYLSKKADDKTIRDQITKIKDNFMLDLVEKLRVYKNYNIEQTEELAYKLTYNYFNDIFEKHKRIINFKDKYNKIIFIKTNSAKSSNHDVTQLSITITNDLSDYKNKNSISIDRHYYAESNFKNKDITKKLRSETKSKYARYFKNDKKNIIKKLGKIDDKTLIITYYKDNLINCFNEVFNNNARKLDLMSDLININQDKTYLVQTLNHFKIFFDIELLDRTSYYTVMMQKIFFNYIYEYGIEENKDTRRKVDHYLVDTELRSDYLECVDIYKTEKDIVILYDEKMDEYYTERRS